MKDNFTEEEKQQFQEYFDRSGCGAIAAAIGVIALFWVVVIIIHIVNL